jgi:uncharacterized protein YbaR (Trm112 family)
MDFNYLTEEELQKEKAELFSEYKGQWLDIEDEIHRMYLQMETLIYELDIDTDNTENEVDKEIISLYNEIGRMLYG